MRIKILTFRYSATLGGFDDTALTDYVRDKEVLAFREHFFSVNDVPHVTCIVTCQDALVPKDVLEAARGEASGKEKRSKVDPAAGLDEADRVLFNTLRTWRNETAQKEGVPAYVILTNRELIAVVESKPESPTALSNVPGIGKKKVERYGQALLEALNGKPEKAA